jgi:hypothetical protein
MAETESMMLPHCLARGHCHGTGTDGPWRALESPSSEAIRGHRRARMLSRATLRTYGKPFSPSFTTHWNSIAAGILYPPSTAPQPHDCRCCHDFQFSIGHHECLASETLKPDSPVNKMLL